MEAMKPKVTTPPGLEFDKAAQTSKRLTEQTFDARFRSETARAAAFKAMEEANELRDLNDQTLGEAKATWNRALENLNGRPWTDASGKAINDILPNAWAAHEKESRTIAHDLDMALAEAERLNPPGPPLKGFRKPLKLTGPEPDSVEPFKQAAGSPDWAAIFWRAAKGNISIEAARAEMEPAHTPSPEPTPEPSTEPPVGQHETPPAQPEQGIDIDR